MKVDMIYMIDGRILCQDDDGRLWFFMDGNSHTNENYWMVLK